MRRLIKSLVVTMAVGFVGLVAFLAFLQISGNFHEVSRGTVYRAAQMDGQDLVRWTQEHGIASVLNLRGRNDGADWYETERAVSERLGVVHIDFAMSAQAELTDAEVRALVQVMRDAPKPMLVHCRAGSDRTGIASALYLAGIEGRAEAEAEHQLSIRYGHVGLRWISKAWAMDETWERIEPWLGYPSS